MKIFNKELENELESLVEKIIQKTNNKITSDDAKQIVNYIIPEIDRLISKRIKEHFKVLAEYMMKKIIE